jgi:hypothetical protein
MSMDERILRAYTEIDAVKVAYKNRVEPTVATPVQKKHATELLDDSSDSKGLKQQ